MDDPERAFEEIRRSVASIRATTEAMAASIEAVSTAQDNSLRSDDELRLAIDQMRDNTAAFTIALTVLLVEMARDGTLNTPKFIEKLSDASKEMKGVNSSEVQFHLEAIRAALAGIHARKQSGVRGIWPRIRSWWR